MAKSCSCNDFTRSAAAAPRRRRGGQGTAEDRAGDAAARRHGPGPAHVPAALRRRGAVGLRRLDARPAPLRRGHRRGVAAGAANQPVLVSIFMEGGWDALSVLAPVGRRPKRTNGNCARSWALDRRRRQALHRGSEPDVASGRRRVWPNCTKKARSRRFPAIGYEPAGREPLHEPPLLGGRPARRATRARAGWGASWTCASANRTTRCRASRSTTRWRRRSRPRRCRSRRSPRPPTTRCGPTAWANR